MNDLLEWLQYIYSEELCDGSWEHEHGFSIGNIDNPGWVFTFDLEDTDLLEIPFNTILVKQSDTNWYKAEIKDKKFIGYGGAINLIDILQIFKDWYDNASNILDNKSE